MSITNEPREGHLKSRNDDERGGSEGAISLTAPKMRWPVVQALRAIGREATLDEIADQVADSLNLTREQQTARTASGNRTKLLEAVMWSALELKHIGVLHYPRRGYRALTPLGQEVDEERIEELRAAYEASRPSSGTEQRKRSEPTETPTAWLIRAGGRGEFAESFIENGIAAIGFDMPRDLADVSSRDEMAELVSRRSPESSDQQVRPRADQLWTIRSGVRRGDLVAMPCKGSSQFALGTVTRGYWYRHDSDRMPHTVSVDWKRTDVPRAAVEQDLLRTLSYRRTIRSIRSKDEAWRLHQLLETGRDPGARDGETTDSSRLGADLPTLVEQFRIDTGYPTATDLEQERLRAEWAEKLAPANVGSLSREDLSAYTNFHVNDEVQPDKEVQQWIRELDDDQYGRLLDSISDLCWGEDELPARIDRLVDWGGARKDTGTKGFANWSVSATLAICHPDTFLPTHTQEGVWGRVHMLRAFGLPEPRGSTYGQQFVDANHRLRDHLAPYFDDDPLAIATFLKWLRQHSKGDGRGPGNSPPDLDELAARVLVGVDFLEDIVSLLEDKGQVILYGPPGTGKTYLARELAKTLAPEESCRALVQFHPSTSYEDFFEGYRPAGTGNDGGIRYELTPGPLARMAEQASEASDRQHVMIIDEINRGNLPRVLGELLFLLEYRNENVHPLYRPDERFSLPDNLWFIGTMNTADRSIALVDAALRRRFHFVPFFPDSGPMAGLLDRWLERKDEPSWVGHLVDAVNSELKDVLGGSHLLLGPSHFMKEYGSSPAGQRERLRRIWKYNIEPFIEDQFFGDPDRIERFRFDDVVKRHGPVSRSDDAAGEEADAAETSDAPLDEDAAADNDD